MKLSRRTVRRTLDEQARMDTPAPNESFVNSLEQRLRELDLSVPAMASNVRQLRRGLSRGAAIGVVAALASGAGAAAVAIVASRNDDPPEVVTESTDAIPTSTSAIPISTTPPTDEPTTSTTSTSAPSTEPPTSAAVEAATTTPTPTTAADSTTTAPPPTEPPATAALPPVTIVETTVPPTAAPETAPEATTTPSTEVHTPATMGLDCVMDTMSVTCNWTPGPDGTDRYVVLRSTPSEARGRVLTPEPGATTIVDVGVVPGNTYTYLVHALDAANTSLAHSTPVTLACCG